MGGGSDDGPSSKPATTGESPSLSGPAVRPAVSGDADKFDDALDVDESDPSGSDDGGRRRVPFTESSQMEADLALARAIQEQECAFMMLYHQQALAAAASPSVSRGGSRSRHDRQDRQDRESRQAGSSAGNPIVLMSEGEELEADDDDDDEYGEWEEASEGDEDDVREEGEVGEGGEGGEGGDGFADELGREPGSGSTGQAASDRRDRAGRARSTWGQRQLFQDGGSEVDLLGIEPETFENAPSSFREDQGDEQGEGSGGASRAVAAQVGASRVTRGGEAEGESRGAVGGAEQEGGGGEQGEGGEVQYEDDEAFARALQEEEEREMSRRLLAMAGLQLDDRRGFSVRRRVGVLAAAHGISFDEAEVDGDAEQEEDEEYEEGEEEEEDEDEEDEEEDGDALDIDEMTYEELTALGEVIGTQSKGLSGTTISALPRVLYSTKTPLRRGEDMCAICQLEYEEGEELLLLPPCHHSYHEACVVQWLGRNKVCPVCKEEVQQASS